MKKLTIAFVALFLLATGGIWGGWTLSSWLETLQWPTAASLTAMIQIPEMKLSAFPAFQVRLPQGTLANLALPESLRPSQQAIEAAKPELQPAALIPVNPAPLLPPIPERHTETLPLAKRKALSENFLNPMVSRTPAVSGQSVEMSSDTSRQEGDSVLTCGGLVPPDSPEPDFSAYMAEMQRKIRRHWAPPNLDRNNRIVVSYRVGCDGQLLQARVLESSRLPVADQAALAAIRAASPFNPLPVGYRGQAIEVQFSFDYDMATRFIQGKS